MIQLKGIVKSYDVGGREESVPALRGIDLAFRDNEFVSVLGPSGCGKTTLLNILGGLDRYTEGDLIINGRSTREYGDGDWDTYRNHSIGFVFQSYNLIPHQSVLANVELALTLSGVSRAERRRRAVRALEKVGLGDQLRKKPNQMSGGQMQRVAIARALVNDPDILLADEPTGALDTATSVQIMDILKEISKDKLILMVTHNPELAENYSSRIVRLVDGRVVGDTMPYLPEDAERDAEAKRAACAPTKRGRKKNDGTGKGKKSMSFFTALSLSFQNLMTKKARTILTSFAGSIGIIGIALILALSTGVQSYINNVQRDTLTSYPITIEQETTDMSSMLEAMTGKNGNGNGESEPHGNDAVYSNAQMYTVFNALFATETSTNNLTAFRQYVNENMKNTEEGGLGSLVSSIRYQYDVRLNPYLVYEDGSYISGDLASAFEQNSSESNANAGMYNMFSRYTETLQLWQELLPGKTEDELIADMYAEQYDLVWGAWPTSAEEIVLILDKNNEISDFAFYALGQIDSEEVRSILTGALKGEKIDIPSRQLSYEEIGALRFRLLTDAELYTDVDGDGVFVDSSKDDTMVKLLLANAVEVRISGIIRPAEDATVSATGAVLGYTSALTERLIEATEQSPVMVAQNDPANENFDVLTGLPYVLTEELDPSDAYKAEAIVSYFASLDTKAKSELYEKILAAPDEKALAAQVEQAMAAYSDRAAMEQLAADAYGMDIEAIRGYLASYTDEQLSDMIKEQLYTTFTAAQAEAARAQIKAIMMSPSEEELAGYITQILAQTGNDPQKLAAFVMQDWKQHVTMDDAMLMEYLLGLSTEQLQSAAERVAADMATEMYAANAVANTEEGYAKVAAAFDAYVQTVTGEGELAALYDAWMPSTVSGTTLGERLSELGAVDLNTPVAIHIYAENFEDKDAIAAIISDYNESVEEEDRISYTDYVALLMSGVTSIINAISYGLIAFVSISLVVSSIMIGIITYISVLERTKEIGILRAIGASKHDISLVFNAETLLVGFTAGMLGILISMGLCFPINAIIHHASGVTAIHAYLPVEACVVLVAISTVLTLIAGFLPAGMAARKDPVIALRTE